MRLYLTSSGLDVASLREGRDLVLEPEPQHGADLPAGTVLDDYLSIEDRRSAERGAIESCRQWRAQMDRALTIDGLCLPFIWEIGIHRMIVAILLRAAGIRAALAAHAPASIEHDADDDATALLIDAVANRAGIAVGPPLPPDRPVRQRSPLARSSLGQAVLRLARFAGVPSRLRSGSVVFVSYWPLEPVLDLMLADRHQRPAVFLDKPPAGPLRSLRAATRGGWVGMPGPRSRRRAKLAVSRAISDAQPPPAIDASGVPVGPAVHAAIMAEAARRGTSDLARAGVLRQAFGHGRAAAVLSAWDSEPDARLMICLAKQAGVPTFILSHGVYLLPSLIKDMNVGDEILIWSGAMQEPRPPDDRPVHVVGYPLPHSTPPATRALADSNRHPRVVVLGQHARGGAMIDRRIEIRQYLAAITEVLAADPGASVILRPRPARGEAAAHSAAMRFPGSRVGIDTATPIAQLLSESDLCIGGSTGATLEAALAGTPVIALNLTGFEWLWPLGGDTPVPIARSRDQLAGWLERWRRGEKLPGQSSLLEGLGADGQDSSARILDVLADRLP